MKNNIRLSFLLLFIFSVSCNRETDKKESEKTTEVVANVSVPVFNSDSAFNYVKMQVDFGPRVLGSSSHEKCAQFLISELKKHTSSVIVQETEVTTFDNKRFPIKNIIAEFNPKASSRIMLAAHWDTRPFADQDTKDKNKPILGANDGASGVGVLLELARQLANSSPLVGVDIIFFDAEDYGQPEAVMQVAKENSYCLGSQYWAKNKHRENYFPKYGILLDMVGAKGATFTMEGVSMQNAPGVVKKVWDAANRIGYSSFFLKDKTRSIIDDHYYINLMAQIPCIDIIHYDPTTPSNFTKSWHTHADNMDIIDKKTLEAVGQTLLEVIYKEK